MSRTFRVFGIISFGVLWILPEWTTDVRAGQNMAPRDRRDFAPADKTAEPLHEKK